jgi:FkbM family methyltransferase
MNFNTKYGVIKTIPNDIAFVSELRKGKIYEEDIIINNLIPLLQKKQSETVDDIVLLDIGAHIGSHSIIYKSFIKNCKILCFEPQTPVYSILNFNINENKLVNVTTYNNAVGHTIMNTQLSNMLYDGYNCAIDYNNTNRPFNYGGVGLGENGEKVNMITIDSLNLDRCDYMKIDVEGAEILVLMGAINTIQKYKPAIFFEHTDKIVSGEMKRSMNITFEIPNIFEFLKNIGYNSITNVDNNNYLAI